MIYLAYIAIFLRIFPVVLQWNSYSKRNLGSLYFLLFSFFSLISDLIGIFFNYFRIHTDGVFNIYQIFETVIVTYLAIEIGKFNRKIRVILFAFCFVQGLLTLVYTFNYKFDYPQDYNWGVSRIYILIITFLAALHFVRNINQYNKINAAPLIGLLGVFIYEALSIIPMLSQQLQRKSINPAQTFVIYFVFMVSGNLIRDALISFNAIFYKKHKRV